MADFDARTASTGGKIKEGISLDTLQEYLNRWLGGEIEYSFRDDGSLCLYGYGWFDPQDSEAPEDDPGLGTDEKFLKGLAPFLAPSKRKIAGRTDEYLIIVESIGAEKCRFPLSANRWTLRPNGDIECHGL